MEKRKCYSCEIEKPLNEFHNDKTQHRGKAYQCKKCKSIFRKQRRKENPEHYKEQQKKNIERNLQNIRKSQKEHFLKNKEKINEKRRQQRKTNFRSFKDRARTLMHWGIKLGYLTRPGKCSKCMKECKPDGHHDDYTKPLEVRWLCKLCHNHEHGKLLDVKT